MMAPDSTNWERVPVVDLCAEHVDCVNRTAPVVEEPTPFKMIRTTNVRNGFIDTDNVRYVTEETYKRWTRRLVPKRGDVILTREAPLGGAGKVRSDDHIFLGQRLYHFRPDPNKLDADFLLYALMAPDLQGQIRALGSGATVEHMRLGDIPSLEIEAPALSVQRQIGSILSAYDELIENNQRRIKILEEVVRSLYREWFILFRFPGHDKVKMVSSPLGPIPQGWEVKKLADLTAFLSRGISPKYDEDGDSIVINQKCIRDQRLSLEPARRQTKSIPADKRVRCGDVLINSTGVGTLGRVAQVYEDMEQCTVDSHVTLVRPNSDTDVDFFGCTLLLKQETFERSGIGATGQTELSRMAVGEVKIPVPPDLLQRRFGALAHPMRTATSTLSKQTENLRRTRDLLLPRLLSG